MKLFISLSGPSSAGKTTLANHLKQYFENRGYKVCFITNVSREIIRDMLGGDLTQTLKDQKLANKFQLAVTKAMVRAHSSFKLNSYDVVISDRTIYDCLPYSLLTTTPNTFYKVFKMVKRGEKKVRYTHKFYLHREKYIQDGYRYPTEIINKELFLFERLVKPYCDFELEWKPIGERVNDVLKKITKG